MPSLSRRALLAGLPASAAVVLTARPAVADDYVDQGFHALAAYVLPGDDAYSRRQAVTAPRAGGVAAGTAGMLKETYDHAVQISVAPHLGVHAPGAGGIAALLDLYSRKRYPLKSVGPFAHPFANLAHAAKARVLADIDTDAALQALPLGFGFNTIITLAAFGAFGERAVYRDGRLTARPLGWQLTGYAGVSDGHPELRGYWAGRRAVRDVGEEA
ncbi:hypothetical protein ACIB24_15745 [Spongisporangium articulatum]|uniref:Uncharacterized protein n=1 Tax=Spongisporangium articulatum TaxID=3362603 RepID=A0ABW8AQ81_9ACTN